MQRFSLQSRAETPREPAAGSKPVSIVLVEDNPADVGLVREALEEHGIEGELLVVNDGEEAIQVIENIAAMPANSPNLLIVDLNLPKKPGREVLKQVHLKWRSGRTPIVALSSSDSQRDRDDAFRLGVSRYIRKPSHLDEFVGLGAIFKEML